MSITEHGPLGMAVFSDCRRYRYWLDRGLGDDGPTSVFVMLNPSTADCHRNDPTVRRCIGFARRWNCSRLIVTNAFALRSTDPRALRAVSDPVGEGNLDAIKDAVAVARDTYGPIVVAWGQHGGLNDHDETVLGWIESAGGKPLCLGTTRAGFPRHPLYVPAATAPVAYAGRVKR